VKIFWRIASFAFVGSMVLVLVPMPWDLLDRVDWGSAPEWIAAVALVALAIGVWRLGRTTAARSRVRTRLDIARDMDR
jgi:hypothetical protein